MEVVQQSTARKQTRRAAPMPMPKPAPVPQRFPQRGQGMGTGRIIAYAVIILLILGFVYVLVSKPSVPSVGSGENLTLAPNQTSYFMLPGSKSTGAVYLKSSGNGTATLYLGTVPILGNPVEQITLASGTSANASSTASGVANLHVTLVSASANHAVIRLKQVDTSLDIGTSAGITVLYPATFGSGSVNVTSNSTGTKVSTTTKASSSTTSGPSVSSVSVSSVTVSVSSLPIAQIYADANATALGALAFKFDALWTSDIDCTPGNYNATYHSVFGYSPVPPYDYYNESLIVPYGMNTVVSSLGGTEYTITYNFESHSSFSNKAAMVVKVDVAASTPVLNITTKGYWAGLNYTVLNSTYTTGNKNNGNNCGGWIP